MQVLEWYLCGITGLAVVLTVCDKIAAKCRMRRIPEATLFTVSLLGGSAAMYLCMLLIRHKTKHKRFMLGLPALVLLQMLIGLFVYNSIK